MKKTLSLILALTLCICFCACGDRISEEETEPTTPIETVSAEALFSDTDNGAKAQLNVGKMTMIYGQVWRIDSSSCTIRLIKPINRAVYVEMPIEVLASLNIDQFVVISGLVSAYNPSHVALYTITATELSDIELMDEYICSGIDMLCGLYDSNGADYVHYYIGKTYDIDLLCDYVSSRGSEFKINDNAQLKNYLTGKWVYSQAYIGGPDEFTCEYKSDGTYVWNYQTQSYGTHKWYDQTQHGDWSVNEGVLESFRGKNKTVYVLCNDVFIQQGDLHVRIK